MKCIKNCEKCIYLNEYQGSFCELKADIFNMLCEKCYAKVNQYLNGNFNDFFDYPIEEYGFCEECMKKIAADVSIQESFPASDKVPRCPKCKHVVFSLYCENGSIALIDNKVKYFEDICSETKAKCKYECPYCRAILFNNRKETEAFLKGKI